MLIGDGVTPGNEGRGYVLRRMLRRAVRSMRLLGCDEPAMPHLLPVSMERMSVTYPELRTDFDRISQVAYGEEEAFRRTLASGTTILDTAVARVKSAGDQPQQLTGSQAFALHDTYGFPIDLTLEMAAEQGVAGRRTGLPPAHAGAEGPGAGRREGEEVRPRRHHASTGGSPTGSAERSSSPGTTRWSPRAGSRGSSATARVSRPPGPATTSSWFSTARRSTRRAAASSPTSGRIELDNGAVIEVRDVQSPDRRGHHAPGDRGARGGLPGALAQSEVDIERRKSISRAHTGPHMVHKAIREALGDTATQAGSENAPGRFRFDFTPSRRCPRRCSATSRPRSTRCCSTTCRSPRR